MRSMDFARLESETIAAEVIAQKEFDEFMTDSEVDNAVQTEDIEHRIAKKQYEGHDEERKEDD